MGSRVESPNQVPFKRYGSNGFNSCVQRARHVHVRHVVVDGEAAADHLRARAAVHGHGRDHDGAAHVACESKGLRSQDITLYNFQGL
jgi:hypothetical protein